MSWLLLCIAGLFEAGWLIGLDKSESFTKLWYVLLAVGSMVISLILFSYSLKDVPVNLAYIVWLGAGACSITLFNHILLDQKLQLSQGFFLLMIIGGIIGLKQVS